MNDKSNESKSEVKDSILVLKAKKNSTRGRLESFQFKIWIFIVCSVIGGALAYAYVAIRDHDREFGLYDYVPLIIIGTFIGAFVYAYFIFLMRLSLENNIRRYEFQLAQLGTDELQESIEENFFTKLIQINFKYIDQYYLQTQEQAEKSFKLATFATISGFVVVLVGVIMMYNEKKDTAYIITGTGIINEFISAVFFYLYNQTILKMSQYHQKLVITQNISLALKMTDEMENEAKTKSLELIIDRLTLDVNKHLSEVVK